MPRAASTAPYLSIQASLHDPFPCICCRSKKDESIYDHYNVLLNACKDIANTGKTKYMDIARHRGTMTNDHIRIGSNSYEKVRNFTYLGGIHKLRHTLRMPEGVDEV